MIAGLVLVAGTVAVASFAVKPNKARAFDLFYGSVFLNDERAPVAVDLTNAKPTVRLLDATSQVSAKDPTDLGVVPLTNATMLLNTATGEFNVVDATGFVIKSKNGGVPLAKPAGTSASIGVAAGASAYIVQTGPAGTSVYLVGQSTVQSATSQGAKVKPRASVTTDAPGSTAPGGAASANGDLWLLVGTGGSRTLRQLTLPRGSDAGVELDSADRATVPSVSSIGVTTGRRGGDAVAVASADQVRVFDGGGSRTLHVDGLSGVDKILPASNQEDRLSFLYHSPSGWSLVSAPAGDGGLVGPAALRGVDPAAELVAPAASNGSLFTMDGGATGRVWQIDPKGNVQTPAGAAAYPIVTNRAGKALEVSDFGDAYAIAKGSRVVLNSPQHVRALAVFTDGSHPPVQIDKSAAVSLNAAGGATGLIDSHPRKNPKGRQPPKSTVKAPPAQPINDKVRCKTTTQIPHIPTITRATPGSRSVQLQWSYPLLDPRDCAPSTYTVSVTLLSSSAPSPPAAITVQGQDGVNLTGLFPDTRYEITVKAFLNGRGTPSAPVEVTTGPEGPAAPTNVHAVTDSSGNWTVSWNSCGGVAQGCVAAATWSVIPSFCDGSGLSSAPATISVAGDPTQHSFTMKFPGNDALLGRGMSFQVQGVGTKGTVGTPARDGGCSYSWSRPVAQDISLSASSPPKTSGQATSATTVAVSFAGGQVHDLGGVGGQLTYKLTSGGVEVDRAGPSTATTAKLSGIRPGQHYQVTVSVSPPRHPEAAVTIGPKEVTPAVATWPVLTANASFATDGPVNGTLTVTIGGLSSADARGETFDLTDSNLICGGGNTAMPLEKSGFDPAQELTFPVDRTRYNGPCSVTVHLLQNTGTDTDPPYFGAGASPAVTSNSVSVTPPTLSTTAGDFAAAWTTDSTRANPEVVVSYHGTPLLFSNNWSLVVSNNAGVTNCGSSNSEPPETIRVNAACVAAGGTFTVHITFAYFLSHGDFTVAVSGTAPKPVDPAAFTFTAAWNGTNGGKPLVAVTTTAGDPPSAALTWNEIVSASTSPGVVCGGATSTPASAGGSINVGVPRANCPVSVDPNNPTAWSVTISYHDPSGVSPDHTYPPVAVTGAYP
jgi:Fibronectin type III domain